jgi:hypothetical protein
MVNGWWLHAQCGLPAPGFARVMVTTGCKVKEEESVGLVFFRGGPLDQYVYKTETLLGQEGMQLPILDYLWTPEKITSEKTQQVAQVWVHKSISGIVQEPDKAAAAAVAVEAPTQPAPPQVPAAATGVVTPLPVPAQRGAEPAPAAAQTGATVSSSAEAYELVTGAVQTLERSDGPVSGVDLQARRKAMKLSVAAVSEQCGLAQSKIMAIEKGIGKRVKDEEIQTLADTIARLEAERGGVGAHA